MLKLTSKGRRLNRRLSEIKADHMWERRGWSVFGPTAPKNHDRLFNGMTPEEALEAYGEDVVVP